jgi:hypothetical protein
LTILQETVIEVGIRKKESQNNICFVLFKKYIDYLFILSKLKGKTNEGWAK